MNRRILLVEDSEHDIALAMAAFEETGLSERVQIARDGQEALDFLFRRGAFADRDATTPIVVLLDLKMPRVNGLQVLEKVKADPVLRMMPIVMLTSSSEHTDVLRSYGLGVNAYVVKPVDFDEFVGALKDLGHFWGTLNQPPTLAA